MRKTLTRRPDPNIYIFDEDKSLILKRCGHCRIHQTPSEFNFSSNNLFNLSSTCKSCKSLYKKEYYYKTYRVIEKQNQTKERKLVINHYGGKCACCGESAYEFLCIDHINGDGSAQRRAIGLMRKNKNKGIKTNKMSFSSKQFVKWVIKNNFPNDLQILCYNCNNAKEYHGTCPHKNGRGTVGYDKRPCPTCGHTNHRGIVYVPIKDKRNNANEDFTY